MGSQMNLPSPVFDENGCVSEEVAQNYIDTVMERFGASPEGVEVFEEWGNLVWAMEMMDYGMRYVGVDLAGMRAGDLEEVLTYVFPRKVSCAPEDAVEIVAELRAFFCFAQREMELPHASACLALLDSPGMAQDIQEELADPANYGMAKSFVMLGQQAGFDMSTKEGLTAFQAVYNDAAMRTAGQVGAEQRDTGIRVGGPSGDARKAKRRKRKAQRRSRKRNR